ncbi:MAG: preprotein translocase subunit YajC [Acidimicrobiales bacterium]|nr:preprotein translocase subunit YajC [Acidimicrobiales bacterium]
MPALVLTLLFIAIGWFFLIRPQQQRMREQQAVVASLRPGDRVITAGGIHGRLVEVDEETVRIDVADGVVLTLARPAVARRVDEGGDLGPHQTNDLGSEADDTAEPGEGPAGEDRP